GRLTFISKCSTNSSGCWASTPKAAMALSGKSRVLKVTITSARAQIAAAKWMGTKKFRIPKATVFLEHVLAEDGDCQCQSLRFQSIHGFFCDAVDRADGRAKCGLSV